MKNSIHKIVINLPEQLFNPEKNKMVDTLTKSKNLKKVNKKTVVNLTTDPNINVPEIVDDGHLVDFIPKEIKQRKQREPKPNKPKKIKIPVFKSTKPIFNPPKLQIKEKPIKPYAPKSPSKPIFENNDEEPIPPKKKDEELENLNFIKKKAPEIQNIEIIKQKITKEKPIVPEYDKVPRYDMKKANISTKLDDNLINKHKKIIIKLLNHYEEELKKNYYNESIIPKHFTVDYYQEIYKTIEYMYKIFKTHPKFLFVKFMREIYENYKSYKRVGQKKKDIIDKKIYNICLKYNLTPGIGNYIFNNYNYIFSDILNNFLDDLIKNDIMRAGMDVFALFNTNLLYNLWINKLKLNKKNKKEKLEPIIIDDIINNFNYNNELNKSKKIKKKDY
jgi:hypothetical protein